jgi:16S rRNA (guanine966-N2)-methyltransferase
MSKGIRVTGGRFRGRVIPVNVGAKLRPSTGLLKEAFCSQFQVELCGARVLDGFAGTGAVGLECLSRGAAFVLSVEKHHGQAVALKKLCGAWQLLESDITVLGAPLERVLGRPCRFEKPFDIVFLDPPYELVAKVIPGILNALLSHGWLSLHAIICVEHNLSAASFDQIMPLGPWQHRIYGDTSLSMMRT